MKYNSKENEVVAVQWTGDNTEEIRSIIPFAAVNHVRTNSILDEKLTVTTYTNETVIMYKGYYLVIPVKGDTTFIVLSPSVFYEMYASSGTQFKMGKFYKYTYDNSWILVICTDPQPYSETSFSGTVVAASANVDSLVGSHTALWLKQNFKEESFDVVMYDDFVPGVIYRNKNYDDMKVCCMGPGLDKQCFKGVVVAGMEIGRVASGFVKNSFEKCSDD